VANMMLEHDGRQWLDKELEYRKALGEFDYKQQQRVNELSDEVKKQAEKMKWAELAKDMAKRQSKDAMSNSDMADVLRYVGVGGSKDKPKAPASAEPTIDDLVAQEVRKLR